MKKKKKDRGKGHREEAKGDSRNPNLEDGKKNGP